MLTSVFTSKTGQSVAHNRHGIFLFGCFCQKMDIFRHFICLILDSRVPDRTKQIGIFALFSSIFSSTQLAPVLGNADLRYNLV